MLCVVSSSVSSQPAYSEDLVKAVLLERIVTFLSWSASDADSAVEVVVLVQGTLGSEVQRVYSRRKFAGRSVAVRFAAKPEDVGKAHIVIIGREHGADLNNVLG